MKGRGCVGLACLWVSLEKEEWDPQVLEPCLHLLEAPQHEAKVAGASSKELGDQVETDRHRGPRGTGLVDGMQKGPVVPTALVPRHPVDHRAALATAGSLEVADPAGIAKATVCSSTAGNIDRGEALAAGAGLIHLPLPMLNGAGSGNSKEGLLAARSAVWCS